MAHFDLSEVKDFAKDLGEARRTAGPTFKHVVEEAAQQLVNDWQRNARETALPHGKWYPRSIGFDGPTDVGGTVTATAGPDASMPQGGMGRGFEYGSINQTYPHMDGHRAADDAAPRFAERALVVGYDHLRIHVEH